VTTIDEMYDLAKLEELIIAVHRELCRFPSPFEDGFEEAYKEFSRLVALRFEKIHGFPPVFPGWKRLETGEARDRRASR